MVHILNFEYFFGEEITLNKLFILDKNGCINSWKTLVSS